jgi:hypothetical protein
MLPKKKQPEPTLLERIHAFRVELDNFIAEKAAELKRTRDGADLPIWDLRHMLTKGDTCLCRCVARMLGDPDA